MEPGGFTAEAYGFPAAGAWVPKIPRTARSSVATATSGISPIATSGLMAHRSLTRSGTGRFSFRVFASIDHAGLDASLHEHADLVASMRSDHPREAGEAMIAHIRQGLSLQLRGLAE